MQVKRLLMKQISRATLPRPTQDDSFDYIFCSLHVLQHYPGSTGGESIYKSLLAIQNSSTSDSNSRIYVHYIFETSSGWLVRFMVINALTVNAISLLNAWCHLFFYNYISRTTHLVYMLVVSDLLGRMRSSRWLNLMPTPSFVSNLPIWKK